MSANPYYQPVKGKVVNCGTPSAFRDAFYRAFNTRECILHVEEIPILHGIAAGSNNSEIQDAVTQLIEAIEKHGEIRIWFG